MILKETLRGIVKSQRTSLSTIDYGVKRELINKINLDVPFALVLSGVRRCGKSTLLRQLIKKSKKFYYFNFEDPQTVNFEVSDFQKLNEIFVEEYGNSDYYFFDEIQNVQKWELFVRSMLDKGKRFIITGSNASLLSKELGTRLTGRHLRYELFPFSYNEMLRLTNKEAGKNSFDEYLRNGGFPEFLKIQREDILQELFRDIVVRDIAVRHGLRELKTITGMGLYLLTNVGKEFSYNKLKKVFGLGSTNTVISFISYFEDSYLLFTVPRFDYSLKKQLVNPKKVYSIDNGLSSANSVSFSADKGRMLENTVFQHLRRKYENIFYFREINECDFVVKEKEKITSAIQVCYELSEYNKDREVKGLVEALNKFELKQGLILTFNQEDLLEVKGKRILVKPVWKWLLL
ncbi:MAG: ATP-binding protein [Nanoarchaeota archaeon]|nr:ATP-binding protein [Nanoarchaeota archaeon]